jgi:hypothetical protein
MPDIRPIQLATLITVFYRHVRTRTQRRPAARLLSVMQDLKPLWPLNVRKSPRAISRVNWLKWPMFQGPSHHDLIKGTQAVPETSGILTSDRDTGETDCL